MRNRLKRSFIWSEELAYILGLITTDGCLLNDGRHIDFTSKDLQLAELYRSIVKPESKMGTKSSGSLSSNAGKPYFRVQIGDVAFYDFLLSCGLTTRKSLTLQAIRVPDEYFADFLRGCFDGDGSIYSYWDRRWKNSLMFYTTFTSASPFFLSWLQEKTQGIFPEAKSHIRKSINSSVAQLSFAKRGSRALYGYMYYDPALPCLHRKRDRYLEIFAADPYP